MKIQITESDIRYMVNEIFDYFKSDADPEKFYNEFSAKEGWYDEVKVLKSCLEELKKSEFIFSPEKQFIKLDNGCGIHMRWRDIMEGHFELWEIWVPGGAVLDGSFADDDSDLDYETEEEFNYAQKLDQAFQYEIDRHAPRKRD